MKPLLPGAGTGPVSANTEPRVGYGLGQHHNDDNMYLPTKRHKRFSPVAVAFGALCLMAFLCWVGFSG
eukprot:SAG25_NODE_8783_length_404_cov_1.190164_1_plen_67_part_10